MNNEDKIMNIKELSRILINGLLTYIMILI